MTPTSPPCPDPTKDSTSVPMSPPHPDPSLNATSRSTELRSDKRSNSASTSPPSANPTSAPSPDPTAPPTTSPNPDPTVPSLATAPSPAKITPPRQNPTTISTPGLQQARHQNQALRNCWSPGPSKAPVPVRRRQNLGCLPSLEA